MITASVPNFCSLLIFKTSVNKFCSQLWFTSFGENFCWQLLRTKFVNNSFLNRNSQLLFKTVFGIFLEKDFWTPPPPSKSERIELGLLCCRDLVTRLGWCPSAKDNEHCHGKIWLIWPKFPISSFFGQNSEMQSLQDYTDPTILYIYKFVHIFW